MAVQWLGPRVSFSLEDAGGRGQGREAAVAVAGAKAGTSADANFEFLLGGRAVASMLPVDELFCGGKLIPLRIPAPLAKDEAVAAVAVGAMTVQSTWPPKHTRAGAGVGGCAAAGDASDGGGEGSGGSRW